MPEFLHQALYFNGLSAGVTNFKEDLILLFLEGSVGGELWYEVSLPIVLLTRTEAVFDESLIYFSIAISTIVTEVASNRSGLDSFFKVHILLGFGHEFFEVLGPSL